MAVVRGGQGIVLPHVQKFADAIEANTNADSFGTYNGHDPDISRAMDVFVPIQTRVLGDSVTGFALAGDNWVKYGVYYMIYRQRIYNREIGSYWRDMARRGDPNVFDYTANHYDHVHFSFYEDAPVNYPTPIPAPTPAESEIAPMWIFDGPDGVGGIWYTDGYAKWGVPNEADLIFWQSGGVKHLGKISKDAFYGLRLRNDGIVDNPGVG